MNVRLKRRITGARVERGSVLAVCTLGMLSVLFIAGMCIDVSHLYMAKVELQDAADASALAAASQLNSTAGGIKLAMAEATKNLNKYDIKQNVTIPASAVTFSTNLNGTYVSQSSAETNAANIRFVKVVIPPKPVGMSLSAMVLGQSQNLGATATGGMSVGLTMNRFYTPLIFIEPNSTTTSDGHA